MSYTLEKLEKSQIKLVFDVDAATFAKAINEAYEKTKHKFQIQGFRKGHVPKKVIEGIYGKEVFYEDAMDIVIPDAYGEAINAENLDPVAQPDLTAFDFKEDGGATFTLIVTVKPEIKLGAYKNLAVEKKVEKITAKQVDAEVEKARERQARLIDVDGKAENGMTVEIDFVGKVDGVAFDGGAAENYELELGSGHFIPGFEDQLVGVKAGDKKDVVVTFPADYQATELQSKEAVFECTVHAVKKKELPALDDEFVKDISEFDTLAEYKKDVQAKLQADAEKQAEMNYEDALIQAIVDNAEGEIPAAMIENEAEDMVAEFEYRLQYQGMKLDDYLGYIGLTKDQLKDEYKAQAEKSVKVRLVMEEIVKAEDLKFSEEEIDAKIAKIAEDQGVAVDDFKKTLKKDQIDYIINSILSTKLMETLKGYNPATAKKAAKKPAEPVAKEEVAEKPAKKAPAKKAAEKEETKAEDKPAKKAPAKKAAAKKEDK